MAEYDSLWNKEEPVQPPPQPPEVTAPSLVVSTGVNQTSGNYISFMSSMQHLQTITAQPLETEPITQKSEVERYLEMGPLPPATNILDWWASQDHIYIYI